MKQRRKASDLGCCFAVGRDVNGRLFIKCNTKTSCLVEPINVRHLHQQKRTSPNEIHTRVLNTWFGLLYSIDLIPLSYSPHYSPRRGVAGYLATTRPSPHSSSPSQVYTSSRVPPHPVFAVIRPCGHGPMPPTSHHTSSSYCSGDDAFPSSPNAFAADFTADFASVFFP